jgi:hypothetical protein
VHTCRWIAVGHYRIYLDTYVVYSMCAEYLQFGLVKNIFIKYQRAYLVIQTLVTLNYNENFRAFEIQHTNVFPCWALADFKDHYPCVIHDVIVSGKKPNKYKFVQTRYMIV